MMDGCQQEAEEMNGAASASDDDSISLLCDLKTCRSRGQTEHMEIQDSALQVGTEEPTREPEAELPKPAEVQQKVKIPGKARLHRKNGSGATLLHEACKRRNLAQVRALLQAGISVNMADYAGWTALHVASAVGDQAVVEELLKAGADVRARSACCSTPLHDAVYCQQNQVVKLLLQYGSDPSDRNLGGLRASDMSKDEKMSELLLTFRPPPGPPPQPSETPAVRGAAGEIGQHVQLPHQSSSSSNAGSRESGVGDGAREHGVIQRRPASDNSRSEVVTQVLEDVKRKQAKISTWPLTCPEDAGKYHAALTHIHGTLMEVLAKHQQEGERLSQTCRSVAACLWKRVLRGQLTSLASRQTSLVEVLQNQVHLVETYVGLERRTTTRPSIHQTNTAVLQQPCHSDAPTPPSSNAAGGRRCPRKKNQPPLTQPTPLRSAPDPPATRTPAPSLTQKKKRGRRPRSSAPQPEQTSQHAVFQIKRNHALIQRGAEDGRRHLPVLIQTGVIPPGGSLQVFVKGQWFLAQVLADGSIKDRKGKLHRTPALWLESIFGNNIPVSSAYAWSKVTFRDKPLDHYLFTMEAERDATQASRADPTGSPQEESLADAGSLDQLMKISIIHLVQDEELVPNAVLDSYWAKLLSSDPSESEDWGEAPL